MSTSPPIKSLPRGSSVADRLMHRRQVDDRGCWLWLGHIGSEGYGGIAINSVTKSVHRVAYETFVGPIPVGMVLDHLCRVRACFNPDHLEPVTQRTNVMRSPLAPTALYAARTHCNNGHEFTPENTFVYDRPSPSKGTARRCRTCQRATVRAYKARRATAVIEEAREQAGAEVTV